MSPIVLATAKIHILKQFTTPPMRETSASHCACHCKDTHFEAIHNPFPSTLQSASIVLATAKIHILKQFTTIFVVFCLSSYCACHCKDTHFEAIHNRFFRGVGGLSIVLATAKIHILKQFTTLPLVQNSLVLLCLPLQRYTF